MKKWLLRAALALVVIVAVLLGVMYQLWIRGPMQGMASVRPDVVRPAVIAHRGASYLAPEETEPAYLLARDLGVDYLEGDVRRSKDGVLFLFHDDTPARTTNAAELFPGREKDPVESFTIEELKQLDAGSKFNAANPDRARPAYAGVRILTVEEMIAIAEGGEHNPAIYLETKSPDRSPNYEADLVELLRAKGWMGSFDDGRAKVIFQSFYRDSLERVRELAPDAPRIYLFTDQSVQNSSVAKLIADAPALGCGIGPVGYMAWPWQVGPAHRLGLLVHPFTLNEVWQFRLFHGFGADGFFTDRPDRLMAFYGRPVPAEPEAILRKHGY